MKIKYRWIYFIAFSCFMIGVTVLTNGKPLQDSSRLLEKNHRVSLEPKESWQKEVTKNSSTNIRRPAVAFPEEMAKIFNAMKLAARESLEMDQFLRVIKKQKPVVTRQSNPYTGEMFIIRTQKPLIGSRYFHAQVFSNEEGEHFLQHMSVEFKKGEKSMDQVSTALQSTFGTLGEPLRQTKQFRSWKVEPNYVLWVKKMDSEDLQSNPFNAYTSQDLGTIRVALELQVHDG